MISNRFIRLMTASLLASVLIISCKKEISDDDELTPAEEEEMVMNMSESEAEAEFVFNDVFDNVMGVNNDVGMAGVGVFGRTVSGGVDMNGRTDTVRCFTVTYTHVNAPNFFPLRITVDFGNGCTGVDGHVRSGKIITEYTNRLVVPGASATTVFQNFFFDSVKVEGTHKVTNTSTSQVHQFKVEVQNAKLIKPNGNYSQWNSTRTITQMEGLGTVNFPFDDIYKIQGSANGKVKRGDRLFAWMSEITEPLIKKFTCRWIVKGRVRTARVSNTNTSSWVAVLDYGNGNCDNQATVTINGITHQITLH